MKELFYGIGAAALVGLACGGVLKPGPVQSATRDGSMTPVEQGYSYDDGASYAPTVTPVYYDSWASKDQAQLLQTASYDAGDADVPQYDPRPAPEDRADAIRQAVLQDNLSAPPPEETTARYPSATGDILAGLTPHMPVAPLPGAAPPAKPILSAPIAEDEAATGATRPATPLTPPTQSSPS